MSFATPASSRSPAVPHSEDATRPKNSILYSPAAMVACGLALRIGCIVLGRLYRMDTARWTMFEMANIGRSLALGHGFSTPFYRGFGSPWDGFSGPTAWTAPLYPFVVALSFKLFGVFSTGAAFALLTFNSLFSALTSWTTYAIARRVFGIKVAAWCGWFWAFYPYAIYWSVTWIWETCLSTFLLSLMFLLTLDMESDNRLSSWFRYGVLWGVVALTNTSVVSWLPFSGCWLAYRLYRSGKSFLVPVVLSAITFWAVITPWLVRNYVVFDKFIFVRGDLGSELRTGNNPLAQGAWVPSYRAGNDSTLYMQYKQMGEMAFDAEQSRLARQWIAEDPVRFLKLSGRKFLCFWFALPEPPLLPLKRLFFMCLTLAGWSGLLLGFRRHVRGIALFAALMACYPFVYYITFASTRYRHPIEPELLILAVWLLAADSKPATPQPDIAKA